MTRPLTANLELPRAALCSRRHGQRHARDLRVTGQYAASKGVRRVPSSIGDWNFDM